ncbi:MAG: MFS transporter, partial [Alphaproteobacteria bacterium]|nr:MFS transporter [Alphaproteobacteria bacterium]
MSTVTTARPSAALRPSAVALLLVSAAIILSISMGIRQSLGLFLRPMNLELGVSASAFGFALALQNIVWGFSQPFVGMIGDRWGPRPVLAGSALVYAAGLVLMSAGGTVLGLGVGGGVLVGLGVAGSSFGVLLGAVSRAVRPERRSQTVGMVAGAGSLATLVLAPAGQSLIDLYGWRSALLVFAAVALAMTVLAAGVGRGAADAPDVAAGRAEPMASVVRAALAHPGFLAMTIAFFACGFQLMFITTHLPTYLALCGVPPTAGATALGLIGLGNAVGSMVIGLLGARFSQKRLLALIYLLRTVAIATYLAVPVSVTSTLVFAATMGFLWLSVAPLVSGLVGRLFGFSCFNTLYGIVFFSHQVGSFLGAWAGGLTFDWTGSYATAWGSLLAVGTAAFLVQWAMDDRTPAERAR